MLLRNKYYLFPDNKYQRADCQDIVVILIFIISETHFP